MPPRCVMLKRHTTPAVIIFGLLVKIMLLQTEVGHLKLNLAVPPLAPRTSARLSQLVATATEPEPPTAAIGSSNAQAATLLELASSAARLEDTTAEEELSALRVENSNLKKNLQLQTWQLNFLQARPNVGISYPLENGLAANCIPTNYLEQFGAYNAKITHSAANPTLPSEHSKGQLVSDWAFDNMEISGSNLTGRPIWTRKIWDHHVALLNNGKPCAPRSYPGADTDLLEAYRNEFGAFKLGLTPSTALDVAVFSAISPWAEATLKHFFADRANVHSIDFNPCIIRGIPNDQLKSCTSVKKLRAVHSGPTFDAIVSFSGIEHDGLGRYGDPINADGDLHAMREMWLLLRPNGIVFLAVPTIRILQAMPACGRDNPSGDEVGAGARGTCIDVWGNGHVRVLQHRLYTPVRFKLLFRGFRFQGWVTRGNFTPYKGEDPPGSGEDGFAKDGLENGKFQPVLILKKDSSSSFEDHFLR